MRNPSATAAPITSNEGACVPGPDDSAISSSSLRAAVSTARQSRTRTALASSTLDDSTGTQPELSRRLSSRVTRGGAGGRTAGGFRNAAIVGWSRNAAIVDCSGPRSRPASSAVPAAAHEAGMELHPLNRGGGGERALPSSVTTSTAWPGLAAVVAGAAERQDHASWVFGRRGLRHSFCSRMRERGHRHLPDRTRGAIAVKLPIFAWAGGYGAAGTGTTSSPV